MAAMLADFESMKDFINFDDNDVANLVALGPVFAKHGPAITDAFYDNLRRFGDTARLIEGRVDALKATHHRWMSELFQGAYGDAYFENRIRVGKAHVRVGLDPRYVEGVMTFLRTEGHRAIHEEVADVARAGALYDSLVKILDLDLADINLAYAEERLDRLTSFTGMSRKLLENCIRRGT